MRFLDQHCACIPLTVASTTLLGRRAEWAAQGLRRGYIDLAMHTAVLDTATQMAVAQTRRWWMPRHDQPWRYDERADQGTMGG